MKKGHFSPVYGKLQTSALLVHISLTAYQLNYSVISDNDIMVKILNSSNINHVIAVIIDYLLVSVSYLLH